MNPLDSLARMLLLQQGYSPAEIAKQLKILKSKAPTQGNLFNLFQQDPIKTNTPAAQLKPGPVRPPAPGQMPLFQTPRASGVLIPPKYNAISAAQRQAAKDKVTNAAVNRAIRSTRISAALNPARGGGGATAILGLANLVQDAILKKYFPETYELKQANLVGTEMNTTREMLRARKLETPSVAPTTTSKGKELPPAPLSRVEARNPVVAVPSYAAEPPKPKPSKPMEKAYGESGKELYMAHKANNPLMIRYFGENYASKKTKEN